MTRVWLSGTRHNEAYLYDLTTGAHQLFRNRGEVGTTAGNGGMIGGKFVATYVGPDRHGIFIAVDSIRYPVDGRTRARAQVNRWGLSTVVVLERHGLPGCRLQLRTPFRWVSRIFDPTWDELDEFVEDRAAGIAALVNSADSRATYLRVKAPTAGPWHLLKDWPT